jgi:transketolase
MRSVAINYIYHLAKLNKKVVFIGSDLSPDTLANFKESFPSRYFMEGVTESHIIGMSAGLASDGWIPFVNTISTFLTRRCFEQIIVDLSIHNLPVRLLGNGAGLVYAPLGHTHISTDDFGIFYTVPNMYVFAPCDENEMKDLMKQTLKIKSPCYFRLTKDKYSKISKGSNKIGKPKFIKKNNSAKKLIISTGIITHNVLAAISKKNDVDLLHFHTVKPINFKQFRKIVLKGKYTKIFSFEEHYYNSGLGSQLSLDLKNSNINIPFEVYGLPLKFFEEYGSQNEILKKYSLDATSIQTTIE